MTVFALNRYDVPTGAVVDTWKSLLGLKAANTTGHRGRLRSLTVAPGGEAAQDINVSLRLVKTDNNANGTSTAVTPKPFDDDAIASIMTGGVNYSVEPTNLETVFLWQGAINGRGGIIKEWAPGEGPVWGKNETLLLLGTPGTGNAVTLVCDLEWEEGF